MAPTKNILHMNMGNGETSYANNSILQKMVILKAWPVLEDTLKDMYGDKFPRCFKVADLGCSSGPNTLFVISEIILTIRRLCQENDRNEPEFQFALNDLPDNDFNTTFKALPAFYEKLKEEKGDGFGTFGSCFVFGVPGSFYGRLFPSKSLDFVHSSYSVHWLSQVPDGLESNKGNICIVDSSPPIVCEAYLQQFQRDFSIFLGSRSKEIVAGGRMVLTFLGRSMEDPEINEYGYLLQFLTTSLLQMATEGIVKEEDVNSYNLPLYTPFRDEVEAVIINEGSFTLDRLEVFEVILDGSLAGVEDKGSEYSHENERASIAKMVVGTLRAVFETSLACHFGESVVDDLFARLLKNIVSNPSVVKPKFFNIVISLTMK